MRTISHVRTAMPLGWRSISKLLASLGVEHFALFGGAIRDSDLKVPINDYDVRVWMSFNEVPAFLNSLKFKTEVQEKPSAGTGRIRYCFDYLGFSVDLTIRAIPQGSKLFVETVAKERASDCDVGLSSVAMDPLGNAYATEEYLSDKANKRLSVYPGNDPERLKNYSERMKRKFPDFEVVWL